MNKTLDKIYIEEFLSSGRGYGKTYAATHNKPFNKAETRFIRKTTRNLEKALLKVRRKLCMAQYNLIKSTINILKESVGDD